MNFVDLLIADIRQELLLIVTFPDTNSLPTAALNLQSFLLKELKDL